MEWLPNLQSQGLMLQTHDYLTDQTTTPGTTCPTLYDKCVGSLTITMIYFFLTMFMITHFTKRNEKIEILFLTSRNIDALR